MVMSGASSSATSSSMSKSLRWAAQCALSSFLRRRVESDGDVAADVYRALRDEAHLLLERQAVSDEFDSDPFDLMGGRYPQGDKGRDGGGSDSEGGDDDDTEDEDEEPSVERANRETIARVKDMMRVASCARVVTQDGYSSIHAIVHLDHDGNMQNVKDNIRLQFAFRREPQLLEKEEERDDIIVNNALYADADDYVDDDQWKTGDRAEGRGGNGECEGRTDEKPTKKRKRTMDDSPVVKNGASDEQRQNRRGGGDVEIIGANGRDAVNGNEEMDYQSGPGEGEDAPADRQDGENGDFVPKTIVTYRINYSVDFGPMKLLMGLDLYAAGRHPSLEEAVPMRDYDGGGDDDDEVSTDGSRASGNGEDGGGEAMDGSRAYGDGEDDASVDGSDMVDDGEDEDGTEDSSGESSGTGEDADGVEFLRGGGDADRALPEDDGDGTSSSGGERSDGVEVSDDGGSRRPGRDGDDRDGLATDRFRVLSDPRNVVDFLDRANLNLDERSVFHLLLTFPFYEREWDVAGLLLSGLLDEEDDGEASGRGDAADFASDFLANNPYCVPCG